MAQIYARDLILLLLSWKFTLVVVKYNDEIKGIHQFLTYFQLWVYRAMLIYDAFFLHLPSTNPIIDLNFAPLECKSK